jgi:hypothetical protein
MVRSNFPSVVVARYGAIGSLSRQTHVVFPLLVDWETSTPFAMTVSPAGTVTRNSNVALSRGLSLTGYQPGDPCGSFTTNAPSSVGTQPSMEVSGSVTTFGVPAYSTVTVKVFPCTRPEAGVTTSSCTFAAVEEAGTPLTSSRVIESCMRKSRSNCDRFSVARAVITAVPTSRLLDGV